MSHKIRPVLLSDINALLKELESIKEVTIYRIENLDGPLQPIFDKCQKLTIVFKRIGPRTWQFDPVQRIRARVVSSKRLIALRALFPLMFCLSMVFLSPVHNAYSWLDQQSNKHALSLALVMLVVSVVVTIVARSRIRLLVYAYLGVSKEELE